MDNLQQLRLLHDDGIHFNVQKYCEFYCQKDVEILRDGFKKKLENNVKNNFQWIVLNS